MRLILSTIIALLLGGCSKDDNAPIPPPSPRGVDEFCYKGVVYLRLDNGNASWGSVKYINDGIGHVYVQTCPKTDN